MFHQCKNIREILYKRKRQIKKEIEKVANRKLRKVGNLGNLRKVITSFLFYYFRDFRGFRVFDLAVMQSVTMTSEFCRLNKEPLAPSYFQFMVVWVENV